MNGSPEQRGSRRRFLAGLGAMGAGLALAGPQLEHARAGDVIPGVCTDRVGTILAMTLVAERVATAFYYTGLTNSAILGDRRLAGASGTLESPAPPPRGNPANLKWLRAALDAEAKHAALLAATGGRSPYRRFFFPADTFRRLGSPAQGGTFLAVLDLLETGFADAYSVAVSQLLALGRPDLAELVARIMGVEAEHRALSRAIAGLQPANDLTLESVPFACASDLGRSLQPFLTGAGLAGGATPPIDLPSASQIARVVGPYQTRTVAHFL